MNEIIEALIQWCTDNGYMVDIQIGTAFPSYAVYVTLKKGKFRYKHEFYMAGGVFLYRPLERLSTRAGNRCVFEGRKRTI